MDLNEALATLKSLANPENVKGMARYGINPHNAQGVSIPNLRKLAKQAGKDHTLARGLWDSGIHEARMLAGMVDDPGLVTSKQMNSWVEDFDSWDVCDQVCLNLFSKTSMAFDKALEWSGRREEFAKRAGFALMACLAVGDKKAPDSKFEQFLQAAERESGDDRNYVKKAVNWALRQVGKRNIHLNKLAIETTERIRKQDAKSARWIASDALRELTDEKILARLKY
ncbi:MAG: DNA alkylation repair protein [Dehalococcoidia bacterium]|jgi:3-methyladenine DNA glycosylase AlkD